MSSSSLEMTRTNIAIARSFLLHCIELNAAPPGKGDDFNKAIALMEAVREKQKSNPKYNPIEYTDEEIDAAVKYIEQLSTRDDEEKNRSTTDKTSELWLRHIDPFLYGIHIKKIKKSEPPSFKGVVYRGAKKVRADEDKSIDHLLQLKKFKETGGNVISDLDASALSISAPPRKIKAQTQEEKIDKSHAKTAPPSPEKISTATTASALVELLRGYAQDEVFRVAADGTIGVSNADDGYENEFFMDVYEARSYYFGSAYDSAKDIADIKKRNERRGKIFIRHRLLKKVDLHLKDAASAVESIEKTNPTAKDAHLISEAEINALSSQTNTIIDKLLSIKSKLFPEAEREATSHLDSSVELGEDEMAEAEEDDEKEKSGKGAKDKSENRLHLVDPDEKLLIKEERDEYDDIGKWVEMLLKAKDHHDKIQKGEEAWGNIKTLVGGRVKDGITEMNKEQLMQELKALSGRTDFLKREFLALIARMGFIIRRLHNKFTISYSNAMSKAKTKEARDKLRNNHVRNQILKEIGIGFTNQNTYKRWYEIYERAPFVLQLGLQGIPWNIIRGRMDSYIKPALEAMNAGDIVEEEDEKGPEESS